MKRGIIPIVAIVIVGIIFIIVFLTVAGFGVGKQKGGEGENFAGSSSEEISRVQNLQNLGTVQSDSLPAPLKKVFEEAGANIKVPPALLAATSFGECGRLWAVEPETISGWLAKNDDVDPRGCNYSRYNGNGYFVWGPMQFLDTTWGINRGDNPRLIKCREPNGQSICAQAGRRTGHSPASMNNIRDSVFGAAIKHFGAKQGLTKTGAKFTGQDWTDEVIREVARGYCNGGVNTEDAPTRACRIKIGNQWLGYGAGILATYKSLYQTFNAPADEISR